MKKELEHLIQIMQRYSGEAEYKMDKWNGTGTTYGDTSFDAAAANCGEMYAYSHCADLVSNVLSKLEENETNKA